MLDKSTVHAVALASITDKLLSIQREFDALQEALMSETKSSAGDKHETGRAMAQLEQEKLSKQLAETRKSVQGLKSIELDAVHNKIAFGSLVNTSRGYFFLSVGIGAVKIEETSVFCITAGSPIGQLLLGKSSGSSIELNGTVEIQSVI
ncbi:3-oxoacyl-ACP synthase [Crocinitomicaceae bacterium]|nr:3-oxoacyl-ACP synthase [Crocinitomicaceae bacterium]